MTIKVMTKLYDDQRIMAKIVCYDIPTPSFHLWKLIMSNLCPIINNMKCQIHLIFVVLSVLHMKVTHIQYYTNSIDTYGIG